MKKVLILVVSIFNFPLSISKFPMKKYILLSILLAASLPAFSQHFEWVKTYTGPNDNNGLPSNEIIESVADSEGNLYILGEFTKGADIDGTDLLPISADNNRSVVIAKISPLGNLVWHKSIYSSYSSCHAYGIKKSGDSTLMIMAALMLPFYEGSAPSDHNYLYYLDTLLTSDDGFLMPTDSVTPYMVNGFITLDLNGNLVENHFLQVAYVDTLGQTLNMQNTGSYPPTAQMLTYCLSSELFTVDEQGNIIVGRKTTDYLEGRQVQDGSISAIKILVDGRSRSVFRPAHKSCSWNQQLLKFSSGFDSLLSVVYILDSTDLYPNAQVTSTIYSIETDKSGNVYVAFQFDGLLEAPISNSDTLRFDGLRASSSLLKYNAQLEPLHMFTLDLRDYSDAFWFPRYAIQHSCVSTAGELFIMGTTVMEEPYTTGTNYTLMYGRDTLSLRDNAFWLCVDTSNYNLISYGKAPSTVKSGFQGEQMTLALENNRVLSQVWYLRNIETPDTQINVSNNGLGLMQWDNEGHMIQYVDFTANGNGDRMGQTHIIDSVVYLTGLVFAGATLGSFQIPATNRGVAFIAKYVDPSFMTPYVYNDPRAEQAIEWSQELSFMITDTPVTLTATATSGLPVTYLCADTSVARINGNTMHLLTSGTTTVTAYQNGNEYGYYPATPVSKTLTVGNVGVSTVEAEPQLRAYPNPTSGQVTIDLASLPPIQPVVRDSSDIQVTLSDEAGAFVKYGNPFRQRVNVKVESGELKVESGVATAWLTDMQGRREEVRLTPAGNGKYTLDLTSRPQATYLLTLTTATGKTHTLRLLKQSDIFGK